LEQGKYVLLQYVLLQYVLLRADVAASPLYVFSSTFTAPPTPNDVLQVLSIIIWSLTFMVTIKYVVIILRADNEGEGGTFSCYSLLTRFVSALTSNLLRFQVNR
jgi:KUP system potassium uptake protein